MSEVSALPNVPEIAQPRFRESRRIARVMFGRWVVVGGTLMILALTATALFAPLIAPYGPNEQDLNNILAPPSKSHLLGTDEVGRDLLTRVIYGSRISLLVGLVAVTIAAIIGMGLGLVAGYLGGWTNIIIMRCIDGLLALPPLVLMLAFTAILGGGLINVLIALGIGMMPTYCRLMCGQVITLKGSDYITAARAAGASDLSIMVRHLLPNSLPPLFVLITLNLGTAIMMEASLSFLGVGITPPTATWGAMVSSGYRFILTNPLISFTPGMALLLVVLSFNMAGDGLRDALDPRLRGMV